MLKCDKKNCTGCGMCSNICPKGAIIMVENKDGFYEPQIDADKCIDCNLCNKVCPALVKRDIDDTPECYAAQLKNKNILKECASGGAFCGVAIDTIQNGGVVYGVANKVDHLEYTKVEKIELLSDILSSKYYQCYIDKKIINDIEIKSKTIPILVSGTPCQISAIINNPRINKKNLITIEIICQGVPSKKVVNAYHKELEKKENKTIVEHYFRSKDYNVGRNYLNKYVFDDGTIKYFKGEEDPLSLTFQRQLFLRNSCYDCKYTNRRRVADFTIGDLWIKEYKNSKIIPNLGVSVIVCNTKRAKEIFEKQKSLDYEKVDLEKALGDNLPYNKSVKKPHGRSISYLLLNSKIKPSSISKILCWKYYIKKKIKGE